MTISWLGDGEPCRAPGCRSSMRAIRWDLSTGLVTQDRFIGLRQGPQGHWTCDNGHEGWIWPWECIGGPDAK